MLRARTRTMLGRTLAGRYRLERFIAKSATTEVYAAMSLSRTQEVVVKLLSAVDDPSTVERFQREASLAARLNHPGAVRILDWGAHEGQPYIVMELVEGRTLFRRLEEGPMPAALVAAVGAQICDVLEAAHTLGIVHRDLKPENVMLAASGNDDAIVIKLLDFGIAKLMYDLRRNPEELDSLTEPGTTIGTPTHMAPEQARGEDIDGRADIYSLGVLMYEMLTGRPPFDGDTVRDVLVKLLKQAPSPLSALREDVPAELEEVVMRCLAKRPSDRWRSAGELRRRLEGLASGLVHQEEETAPDDEIVATVRVDKESVLEHIRKARAAATPPGAVPRPAIAEPEAAVDVTHDGVEEETLPRGMVEPEEDPTLVRPVAEAGVDEELIATKVKISADEVAHAVARAKAAHRAAHPMRPPAPAPAARDDLDELLVRLPRTTRPLLNAVLALLVIAGCVASLIWLVWAS
jgi:protein kinase-like protein